MPLGKYYCDYCNKQFQDTLFARKRHLEGAQHQRAKALWYASFRYGGLDTAGGGAVGGALPPPGVCHHFVRTGFCQFGDGCRYFHPKQNAPNEHQVVPAGPNSAVMACSPSSMGSQHFVGSSVLVNDPAGISWGNLPPSLRPPPEGGYPPLPFIDWG